MDCFQCERDGETTGEIVMRRLRNSLFAFTGLLAGASIMQAASAQTSNQVVGTLGAILNAYQAQQLADQARREGRPAEQLYWQRYRDGLETQGRDGGYGPSGYGRGQQYGYTANPPRPRVMARHPPIISRPIISHANTRAITALTASMIRVLAIKGIGAIRGIRRTRSIPIMAQDTGGSRISAGFG